MTFQLGQFYLANPLDRGQLIKRGERAMLGPMQDNALGKNEPHTRHRLKFFSRCRDEMKGFQSLGQAGICQII